MPCYSPQSAYKAKDGRVTFVRKEATSNLTLPCGNCLGCRMARSQQWGVRMLHEASLHENNMFITLTYDDEHLPIDESLNVKHFQKFMKAYRQKISPHKIRFFHSGEYGEENRRPHYHAIIFNHQFEDLTPWKENLYTSDQLGEIWQNGFTSIGNVTLESATYVAKYILKKITGTPAQEHYSHITRYGEQVLLTPEYTTMSRRPGIASSWYEKYKKDIYPENFISIKGKKVQVPKFYQNKLKDSDPHEYEKLRRKQKIETQKRRKDNTKRRLQDREKCAIARITQRKI